MDGETNRFGLWLLGVAFSGSHLYSECLAFVLAIKLFIRLARFVWQPLWLSLKNTSLQLQEVVKYFRHKFLYNVFIIIPRRSTS